MHKEEVEDLANSCQLELYATLERALISVGEPDAGLVAAALSNHIMQFGLLNAAHANDIALIAKMRAQLKRCHSYLSYPFQQNMLGTIILLGSAHDIPIEDFKNHLQTLHEVDLFDFGQNTPDVAANLPSGHLNYLMEASSIAPARLDAPRVADRGALTQRGVGAIHWTAKLNIISLLVAVILGMLFWVGARWAWYGALALGLVSYFGLPILVGICLGLIERSDPRQ